MDTERLQRALIAADAAGDTQAATELAQALRSAQAAPVTDAGAGAADAMTHWGPTGPKADDVAASFGTNAAMGAASPYLGAAQMLYAGGAKAADAVGLDSVSKWMDDGYWSSRASDVNMRQAGKEARDKAGITGFNGAAMLGNAISTAPLAAIGTAGPSIPLLSAAASSAAKAGATGAGLAAIEPTDNSFDPMLADKGERALYGGGAALLGYGAGRMLGGLGDRPAASILKGEGVTLTPGQSLGKTGTRLEQAATSIPIYGDAIIAGQRRAIGEFNNVAINRALAPIGDKLPKGTSGYDAIEYARKALGDKYDELLPKITLTADSKLSADLGDIIQNMPDYHPAAQKKAVDVISSIMTRHFSNGKMEGKALKSAQEEVRLFAQRHASGGPEDRALSDAVSSVDDALMGLVDRTPGPNAEQLRAVNLGYANFKRVQHAASAQGSADGVFSPEALRSAARALDRSKDKRASSEGSALMQDLANAGVDVLGRKVPDSGTPFRMLANSVAGGGLGTAAVSGMLEPTTMGILAAAALPYTKLGSKTTSGILSAARATGRGVRRTSPILGAIAGPALLDE